MTNSTFFWLLSKFEKPFTLVARYVLNTFLGGYLKELKDSQIKVKLQENGKKCLEVSSLEFKVNVINDKLVGTPIRLRKASLGAIRIENYETLFNQSDVDKCKLVLVDWNLHIAYHGNNPKPAHEVTSEVVTAVHQLVRSKQYQQQYFKQEEIKKNSKIEGYINNFFDKIEVELKNLHILLSFDENHCVQIRVPTMLYFDKSNQKETKEVYVISVPKFTVSFSEYVYTRTVTHGYNLHICASLQDGSTTKIYVRLGTLIIALNPLTIGSINSIIQIALNPPKESPDKTDEIEPPLSDIEHDQEPLPHDQELLPHDQEPLLQDQDNGLILESDTIPIESIQESNIHLHVNINKLRGLLMYENDQIDWKNLLDGSKLNETTSGVIIDASIELESEKPTLLRWKTSMCTIQEIINGQYSPLFVSTESVSKESPLKIYIDSTGSKIQYIFRLNHWIISWDVKFIERIKTFFNNLQTSKKCNTVESKDNSMEKSKAKEIKFTFSLQDFMIATRNIPNLKENLQFGIESFQFTYEENELIAQISKLNVSLNGVQQNQLLNVPKLSVNATFQENDLVENDLVMLKSSDCSAPRKTKDLAEKFKMKEKLKYQESLKKLTPLLLTLDIDMIESNLSKKQFMILQEIISTVTSQFESTPTVIPPELIPLPKVPDIVIHLRSRDVKVHLSDLYIENHPPHSFDIGLRDLNCHVNLYSNVTQKKINFSLTECKKFSVREPLSRIPIIDNEIEVVTKFKGCKIPIEIDITYGKLERKNKIYLQGDILINGFCLHYEPSPFEEFFVMLLSDCFSNPDAPKPDYTDVDLNIGLNSFILDLHTESNKRLVCVIDDTVLQMNLRDPPGILSDIIASSDIHFNVNDCKLLVHNDYSIPLLTSDTEVTCYFTQSLKKLGFATILKMDSFHAYIRHLGDIDGDRKVPKFVIHADESSWRASFAPDSFSALQSILQEVQDGLKSNPQVLPTNEEVTIFKDSLGALNVSDHYFDRTHEKKKIHTQTVSIHRHHDFKNLRYFGNFFKEKKPKRNGKSNGRKVLPYYFPDPSIEITMMLNLRIDFVRALAWPENMNNSQESNLDVVSLKVSEIFVQFDGFPAETRNNFYLRFSIKDVEIVDQMSGNKDFKVFSTLSNRKTFINGSLDSQTLDGKNYMNLHIGHISPMKILLRLHLYRMVTEFLSFKDGNDVPLSGRLTENGRFSFSPEFAQPQTDSDGDQSQDDSESNPIIFNSVHIASAFVIVDADIPLVNIGLLKHTQFELFNLHYNHVVGSKKLGKLLSMDMASVFHSQNLLNIFTSLLFVRSIKVITHGTWDLIALPYAQLTTTGNLLYGIELGLSSFLMSLASETAGITGNIANQVGNNMEFVNRVIGDTSIEDYFNAPQTTQEGIHQARLMLWKGVKGAYQPILAIPTHYRREGSFGVVLSCAKALPIFIMSPTTGMIQGLSKLLTGISGHMTIDRGVENQQSFNS